MIGAIDGSLMPIIPRINASVHPPHETVDRVYPPPSHRASRAISLHSFFFCFCCIRPVCALYIQLYLRWVGSVAPCCCCSVPYQRLDMASNNVTNQLPLTESAKSSKSSAHLLLSAIIPNDSFGFSSRLKGSVSVHILANNALRAITPERMVVCRLMVYQIFV